MALSSLTAAQSVCCYPHGASRPLADSYIADKREFLKISQAVGIGFVVMGVIGYIVKIIHIPINNILVYVFPAHLCRPLDTLQQRLELLAAPGNHCATCLAR
jgi:protein translocase SEC61 complex gamma subunit